MRQASQIPAFFVAFCVTPLASNASELVSSLVFASRKRMKNISLTYCQVCRCISLRGHIVSKAMHSDGVAPPLLHILVSIIELCCTSDVLQ